MTNAARPYDTPGALPRKWAAAWLGMSEESFDRHVRQNLPCAYVGSLRVWSIKDLQKWLDNQTTTTTR